MKKRVNREEAERRIFEVHGDNIKLLTYKNSNTKSEVYCKVCDYYWNVVAGLLWREKHGCPICGKKKSIAKRRHTLEYIKNYIEKEGCQLLSDQYNNGKTKLKVLFECGHEGSISFEHFREGKRCLECKKQALGNLVRNSKEEIIQRLRDRKLAFIEFPNGYVNSDSFVTYKCELGHIDTRRISRMSATSDCKICAEIRWRLSQKGDKGYNWKGGTTPIRLYLRKTMAEWKQKSAESCNFLCVIENKKFDAIHHLYSFNSLMDEIFQEYNISIKPNLGDYTKEELIMLEQKLAEKHNLLLGVCLTKKVHDIFHNLYGHGNNTPAQFEEFRQRIQSGDIIIPE